MSVLNNHENVKATLSNYLQSQMLWSVKRKKKRQKKETKKGRRQKQQLKTKREKFKKEK